MKALMTILIALVSIPTAFAQAGRLNNDVAVSTVWGAAHQASFRGRIVRIKANVIEALEAEEIDMCGHTRLVRNGCRMHIRLEADGTVTSIGGNCGESLSIENAKRE